MRPSARGSETTGGRAVRFAQRWWPEALAVAAITALVVVPVWPGVFTIDSQVMYRAVVEGEISNWYAPVHQALWRVIHSLGFPPATMLLLGVVGLVSALIACFRLALGRVWATVATAAVMMYPPIYGLAGWVGRDVWFAALVLGVVAMLGWAIRTPQRRWVLLGGAFAAAWFAADARQNGFPVLLVVGGVAGWAWAQDRGRAPLRIIGAAFLTLLVGLGALQLTREVVVVNDYSPDEILYFQDLVAMSLRDDVLLVPEKYVRVDDLGTVRELWVDGHVGYVLDVPDAPFRYRPYNSSHVDALRAAWRDAIIDHPLDYAVVRTKLTLQLWGLRDGMLSAWFDRSDDLSASGGGALSWERSRELAQSFPSLADARASFLDAFDGQRGYPGPLHRPWPYLLAGLAGAILLVAAGGASRVFGWAMLALQVLLQGVLALSAPLVQYRFEYFQVLLGIVLAVLGVAAWRRRRIEARSALAHTPTSPGQGVLTTS